MNNLKVFDPVALVLMVSPLVDTKRLREQIAKVLSQVMKVVSVIPKLILVEPGLIYRARTNAESIECCKCAPEKDSESHAARHLQIAQQNSWHARLASLRNPNDRTAISLEGGML